MASLIYLDTHVVVWLFLGEIERFPEPLRDALNEHDLLVSPMVLVELQYLSEIRRLARPALEVFETLEEALDLTVCDLPFERVAREALANSWTRDPFDRFIVSQARIRSAPLATKDSEIHAHYPRALWGPSSPLPDAM